MTDTRDEGRVAEWDEVLDEDVDYADRLDNWADRIGRTPGGTPTDQAIGAWATLKGAAAEIRRLRAALTTDTKEDQR